MTIGIPIALSMQDTNVIDPTVTIEELMLDCEPPIFSKGLEIQDSDWVFEYNGNMFTPKVWNITDMEAGVYNLDEIIIKDCKLMKVTGKKGTGITTHQRPYEPEEYGSYDTNMDSANWSHRYVKVSNLTNCGWLSRTWKSPTGRRLYYMCWDASVSAWIWNARDLYSNNCLASTYLRTTLKDNYSNKFDFAKDIKATTPYWGSTDCIGGCPKEDTVQMKSMVERGNDFYFRTSINAPIEYETWETGTAFQYTYMEILSPMDIDGFIKKRMINAQNPFDGKGYTKAIVDTTTTGYKATWTCLAAAPFDSITFGNIICDSIDVVFKTKEGEVLEALTRFKVDNTVARGTTKEYQATKVLYVKTLLTAETVIEITLHGSFVSVGKIIAADKLDAGFTSFNFSNEMKDLTPTYEDQCGNWEYADGGMRLRKTNAEVKFPILDYDGLERMMLMLGGGEVIIDGSDATNNEVPDGKKVFAATQMIARIISMKLSAKDENKRIGEEGTYNIVIQEIV